MTEKIFKNYRSWGRRKRIMLGLAVLAMLIAIPSVATYAALYQAPTVVSLSPAEGGTAVTGNVTIKAEILDTDENIKDSSVQLEVDGVPVQNRVWSFQGSWATDSCGSSYYVITSYKGGTITGTAKLTDGEHTAKLTASDAAGNVLIKNWKFVVASKPVISNFSPANGATAGTNSGVSAKITDDNGSIIEQSIVMNINGVQVPVTWNQTTSTAVYYGELAPGTYNVQCSGTDTANNVGTASWSFTVKGNAPVMALNSIPTVTNGVLKFETAVTDSVNLADYSDLRLDGKPLSASFRYEGLFDSCGYYQITDYKKGYVSYQGIVPDGVHSLTLIVKNQLGNTGTKTWTLNVNTPPQIAENSPTSYLNDLKPVISAKVTDANTGIDSGRVMMTIDGQAVNASYSEAAAKVTYTPVLPLANESYHTVVLTVYDKNTAVSPLYTTRTWKFYTTSYPDMKDSNFESCNACHTSFHGWNYGGTHSNNQCDMCHQTITQPADCYQCHQDPGADPSTYIEGMGHGWSQNIKYGLKKPDPAYVLRVNQNREVFDCIICHQPGSGAVKHAAPYLTALVPQNNNHDIPELHKSPVNECTKCHAQSLTREHARDGRYTVDSAGNKQPISCNTCHKSTNANVKNAIALNDRSCTACHAQADHESVHTTPLDKNCQTCHASAVSGDHTSRKDSSGQAYTCATCHNSGRNDVQRALNNNNLGCAGCHKESKTHNVLFVDKVPGDIPLDGRFQWSAPIEAAIFARDTGAPAAYVKGLVVLSNRNNVLTGDQIWQFLNTELVKNGWVAQSQPVTSANFFTVEFTKETRGVFVRAYKTDFNNGTGNEVGFRAEVWYR